jgi:hypothetical protein
MSVVIGIVCTDGIVLAADQQISIPNYSKRHEHKIDGPQGEDWTVAFAPLGDQKRELELGELEALPLQDALTGWRDSVSVKLEPDPTKSEQK